MAKIRVASLELGGGTAPIESIKLAGWDDMRNYRNLVETR
jgi:hypothetical protein